ncbi:MAG: ATPase, T2SS/T4P/T4SS family [Candidatus Nanoarchaeia archaeon]|nr:ATPase, T2SS/T4P/T4SS family [Candidatus Nanoarchaeia archaeon]
MAKRDLHYTIIEDEAIRKFPHYRRYIEKFSRDYTKPHYYPKVDRSMKDMKSYLNLVYPVGDPIFIHIYREIGKQTQYNVIEPEMSPGDEKYYEILTERLIEISNRFSVPKDQTKMHEVISKLFDIAVKNTGKNEITPSIINVDQERYDILKYYLIRDRIGYGKLEPLFYDSNLEDIHCTGLGNVTTIHKIFGLVYTSIIFKDDLALNKYIRDVSERAGRPVSDANSVVDGIMPDGSRVNMIYGRDVSLNGSSFTIRKFSDVPVSITQIVNWGTMSADVAAYMWLSLNYGMNCFVCGETASGKTTTLNAMCTFIKPTDKVYTVENTPEVTMPHDVWQHLCTREAGKSSDVTYLDLLLAALRSRPNYIIVGEIRGAEGNVAFQAMQCIKEAYFLNQAGLTNIKSMFESLEKIATPKYDRENRKFFDLNLKTPVFDFEEKKVKLNIANKIIQMPKSQLVKLYFKNGNIISVTQNHKFIKDSKEILAQKIEEKMFLDDDSLLKENKEKLLNIIYQKEIKKNNFTNTYEALHWTYNMYQDDEKIFPKVFVKQTKEVKEIIEKAKTDEILEKEFTVSKIKDDFDIEFDKLCIFMKHFNKYPKLLNIKKSELDDEYETLYADLNNHIFDILGHRKSTLSNILCFDIYDLSKNFIENLYENLYKSKFKKELQIDKNFRPKNKIEEFILKDYLLKNKSIKKEKIEYIELPSEEINKLIFFLKLYNENVSRDLLEQENGFLFFKKEDNQVIKIESEYENTYDVVFGQDKYYYLGSMGNFFFINDTGHPVLSTFHAGSVTSMVQRITAPPINVPIASVDNLNISLIQMAVSRNGEHLRRVLSVSEIERYYEPAHKMVTRTVFTWDAVTDKHLFRGLYNSYILEEKIAKMTGYSDTRLIYDELFKRSRTLTKMIELGIFDYYEVWDLMNKFFYGGYDGLPFKVD